MEEKSRNCKDTGQLQKSLSYLSDEALEQLMLSVEEDDLVAAPPDLMEKILQAAELELPEEENCQKQQAIKDGQMQEGKAREVMVKPQQERRTKTARKKEFYAYCFRVVTSVAAAIALVFLMPELSGMTMEELHGTEVPGWEEVVEAVPAREEVVAAKKAPTREEVLKDTGFFEQMLERAGWFDKKK